MPPAKRPPNPGGPAEEAAGAGGAALGLPAPGIAGALAIPPPAGPSLGVPATAATDRSLVWTSVQSPVSQ